MRLLFLIPLIIGLATGYIFKNFVDEIADLTGLVTVFNLILSLVLAPWQIQLLVLMLTLIRTRRLLLQIQYKVEAPSEKEQYDVRNNRSDNR